MSNDFQELMAFADVLIPGDDLFPSATAADCGTLLPARLDAADGDEISARLHAAIVAAGGPLGPLSAEARREVAVRIEVGDAGLFDEVRKILYLTYYEQPAVIKAIRALGIPYNTQPLPTSYPMEAFNPATDTPTHRRGRWVRTEDVVPVLHGRRAQP